jgi:hypothetical protein
VAKPEYDLSALDSLLRDGKKVAAYRQRIADAFKEFWDTKLDPLARELNDEDNLLHLGQEVVIRWLREAVTAYLQVEIARLPPGTTTNKAIVRALGLSSPGNFGRQFPDVERLAALTASAEEEAWRNNSKASVDVRVDGLDFTVAGFADVTLRRYELRADKRSITMTRTGGLPARPFRLPETTIYNPDAND